MASLNGLERETAAEGKAHVKKRAAQQNDYSEYVPSPLQEKKNCQMCLFVNRQVTASVTVTHDRYICFVINSRNAVRSNWLRSSHTGCVATGM